MRVLLVDDDVEMLESLRRMTLALGPEWEVAGLAEDGVEALELLRTQPVDILVTDITMLEMDGLELIEKARDHRPELRSLLITCHEDFQYAQEGIQLGVEDYLLKYTLTQAKFHQALTRVEEKIEKARRQQSSLQHLSTEVYKNREHFRENLIHMVMNAPTADIAPLVLRAPLYGIDLPQGPFTVTAVFPVPRAGESRRPDDEALVSYAVMNVAQELIDFAPSFAFRLQGRIYLLLWNTDGDPAWRGRLADRLAQLRRHFDERFDTRLCAVAGVKKTGFSGLEKELAKLEGLWNDCFYGPEVLLEENAAGLSFLNEPVPGRELTALQEVLFDLPRLCQRFEAACQRIAAARYAPARARAFLEEFITQLQIVLKYSGRWLPAAPVDGGTFAVCREQVQALLEILRKACFWQPGKRPGRDVQQVVEHVNAHLNTELSLESAAELVHKNSSYLSRQFKKETGLSFSEFVIRQRIQKATYLLEHTDLTVERVAAEVGVASGPYFSTFFKRETGRSPGEVRRAQSGAPN